MPKHFCTPRRLGLLFVLAFMVGCAPKQPQNVTLADGDAMPQRVAEAQISESEQIFIGGEFEFIKPADGKITSDFGVRRSFSKKRRTAFHQGVDINAKRGSTVVAAAPGKVVFAGSKGRGYGLTVDVQHSNGLVTRYAHLDKIFVKPGQNVNSNVKLGLVGRTGRTTGPNLHLEVIAQGKPMDPKPFLLGKFNNTKDIKAVVERSRKLGNKRF